MSLLSLVLPTIGLPDSTEDVKLNNALTTIQTWANGNIDLTNISSVTPVITVPGGVHQYQLRVFADTPTLGGGANNSYSPAGAPTFPNACLWAGAQVRWFSDAGRTTLTLATAGSWIMYFASGNTVVGAYDTSGVLYPQSLVAAIGY